MISPALEQLARELTGQVKLVKVNVHAAPKLSEHLAVQAVPTLLMMNGGRVIARRAGATPALRKWVEKELAGMRQSAP